jgi:DNA-binding response OmpR family regulator
VASVLIVAKPYDAEVIRKACAEGGYETQISDGSNRSGEWVEQNRPAVVVLSERLSGVDPPQILRELRSGSYGRDVPVILISSSEGEGSSRWTGELMVNEKMVRPLDPVQLRERIQGVTGIRPGSDAPSVPEEVRRRVEAKYRQVCEGDYFSLLDLRRDAVASDVLDAYQRLCRELGPEAIPAAAAGDLGSQLNEIREVLEEAFKILIDDRLRQAYREAIR